jgi:hypothetical protein
MSASRTTIAVTIPAVLAGTGSLALNYFQAFKDNTLSKHAGELKASISNMTASADSESVPLTQHLITQAQTLQDQLYASSRRQGIITNMLVASVIVLPVLQSLGHHASVTAGYMAYLTNNWDYVLGRTLQLGGITMIGKGIHADGAGNPQLSTALIGSGTVITGAACFFIERNRQKTHLARQQVEANAQPFLNSRNPGEMELGEGIRAQPSAPAFR